MNEGRETHYQPWLRDEDSAQDASTNAVRPDHPAAPVEAVAEAPAMPPVQKPTVTKPPVGLDLNRYSHGPESAEGADPYMPHQVAPLPTSSNEESWGSLAAKTSKKLAASAQRGWSGFANWTIHLGAKANIPARVAAMHLDEKAKAAAEAVAEASKVAANKTAEASKVAANKTAELSKIAANKTAEGAKHLSQKTVEGVAKLELGDKIGDVAEKAGETIKKGASSVVDATKAASETVVDATKSGVETVAKGASDLTRKSTVDAAAIPSALDRLLAEEAAAHAPADLSEAATPPVPATPPAKAPPPLPLFAEVPETVPAQPSPKKQPPKPSYRSMALERTQGDEAFRSAEVVTDPDVQCLTRSDALDTGASDTAPPSPLAARFAAMRQMLKAKMTDRSAPTAASNTSSGSKAWMYALIGTAAIGATLWGVSGKIPPQQFQQDVSSASAPALAAAGIERSDRAEIEAIVHDYILNHPEIIPQAMERYQAKEMAKQIDAVRSDLETPFTGAWTGAANGDVVLVEFADFACGFCRRSVADVERLLREDKNLKVVHRDLPILSEESIVAAKTALAAAKQGKYREYYLAQFEDGPPSEASIKAASAKAGLNSAATQKAFLNGDLQAEIDKNLGFARDLGFNGTPTFIIGDRVLQGAVGYDELKKAIAEARAKK